jgi:hypothetical protein
MSDHGPEEPFAPDRDEERRPRAEEKPDEDEEREGDEPERTPGTAGNPWAKTSSGDSDDIVDDR